MNQYTNMNIVEKFVTLSAPGVTIHNFWGAIWLSIAIAFFWTVTQMQFTNTSGVIPGEDGTIRAARWEVVTLVGAARARLWKLIRLISYKLWVLVKMKGPIYVTPVKRIMWHQFKVFLIIFVTPVKKVTPLLLNRLQRDPQKDNCCHKNSQWCHISLWNR